MDINMPILDGFEATKQIRKHQTDAINKVQIIGLTASTNKKDHELAIEYGMDNTLTKPIVISKLVGFLNTVINTPFVRRA